MALDVLGIGYCCLDDLLLLSEIPPPEGRATIVRRQEQGGGMVATAMVATARLGGNVGFVGRVGDDAVGERIMAEFRSYGVDVSQAVVEEGASSHVTVVLVDRRSGARSFLGQRGSAREVQPEDVQRDYVTGAGILHLSDASAAALQAAGWAKEAGSAVCLDGTHFYPSLLAMLPNVDYLIVSRFFASEFVAHSEGRDVGRAAHTFAGVPDPEPPISTSKRGASSGPVHHGDTEATMLAGRDLLGAAERLRQLGPPVVVVTEGERGSWCVSPQGRFHVPAFAVPAVDTTGAGDVFHGAFLFGMAKGWDLRDALVLASATASLKCRGLGGRTAIPTLDEALQLARGGPKVNDL